MRIKDKTVNHLCGLSYCTNPTHLEVAIPKENRQKAVRKQEVPETKVNPRSRKIRLD